MTHAFNDRSGDNRTVYGGGLYLRLHPLISKFLSGIDDRQEWRESLGVQYKK